MQLNNLQRSWASTRADALLEISADSGPDDCEIEGYWLMYGLNYPGDDWMRQYGEFGDDYEAHRNSSGYVHDGRRESCRDCVPSMHIGPDGAEHEGRSKDCAACIAMIDDGFYPPGNDEDLPAKETIAAEEDWVNPQHYRRGPLVRFTVGQFVSERVVECIEVVRHVPDFRLANAIRYIWRVAFGGKWDDNEDIRKAMWYLTDYVENPVSREE